LHDAALPFIVDERERIGLTMTPAFKLRTVKTIHTLAWALFASAVLLIPVAAWIDNWRATLTLVGVVTLECAILALNEMRCPLTPIAARYTENRADNFDIYLPVWLARYNKQIFGTLFVAGIAFAIIRRFM
jgi:hypothetical protein